MTSRRDRKKQQTRAAIGEAAMRLFLTRGFDEVTVADIAQEADVAVQTVFNHYPTKEDLFFQERESYVTLPSQAVQNRGDSSVAQALTRGYLRLLEDYDGAGLLTRNIEYQRTLDASPALRTRELQLRREREDLLAAALADEKSTLSEGLRPTLMAAFASAVDRVLDTEFRRLAGEPVTTLASLAQQLFETAESACHQAPSGR